MLDAQLRAKRKQSYFLHELMTQRTGNDMEDITYRSAVATDEVVNNSLKAKLSQQFHWLAFPQASPEDVTGQCVACFPAGRLSAPLKGLHSTQQTAREDGRRASNVQVGCHVEAQAGVLSVILPE